MAGEWPLETFLELGALPSAVACARWHAKELWLRSDGAQVMILVWDINPQPPQRVEAGEEAEGGRGLLLVETLRMAMLSRCVSS